MRRVIKGRKTWQCIRCGVTIPTGSELTIVKNSIRYCQRCANQLGSSHWDDYWLSCELHELEAARQSLDDKAGYVDEYWWDELRLGEEIEPPYNSDNCCATLLDWDAFCCKFGRLQKTIDNIK